MADQSKNPTQKEMGDLDPKQVPQEKAQDVRGGVKFSDIPVTKPIDKSTP